MRKKTLITLVLIIPLSIIAQDKKNFNKDINIGEYTPLSASYYANLGIYPGIKLAFDWNLRMIEKKINKQKQTKTIRKLIILSPYISYHSHKQSKKTLIIGGDINFRRYSKRLFFREIGLGLAYLRKFNQGKTWEVKNNGKINEIGSSSRGYLAPTLSLSIGKRFTFPKNTPFDAFAKINAIIITNYNAAILPEPNIEIGIRISLKHGIKRGKINIKNKYKNKQKNTK